MLLVPRYLILILKIKITKTPLHLAKAKFILKIHNKKAKKVVKIVHKANKTLQIYQLLKINLYHNKI